MRERAAIGLERLVFFSDAVFAIAITLLVIDLRLPDLGRIQATLSSSPRPAISSRASSRTS